MNFNVRQHYLTKVLGFRLPLITLNKAMKPANFEKPIVKERPAVSVVVASASAWNVESEILVSKMMAAIGIQEFFFHDKVSPEIADEAHWIFFGDYKSETAKKETAKNETTKASLKLADMAQFFPPVIDEEIQSLKKHTWLELKKFKQEIFK